MIWLFVSSWYSTLCRARGRSLSRHWTLRQRKKYTSNTLHQALTLFLSLFISLSLSRSVCLSLRLSVHYLPFALFISVSLFYFFPIWWLTNAQNTPPHPTYWSIDTKHADTYYSLQNNNWTKNKSMFRLLGPRGGWWIEPDPGENKTRLGTDWIFEWPNVPSLGPRFFFPVPVLG